MKNIFYISLLILNFNLFSQENKEIIYSLQDRNNVVCKSKLIISDNESVFKVLDLRENGLDEKNSSEKNMIYVHNDKISTIIFSNDTISITRIPLYKDEIIYNDEGVDMNLNITKNHKVINNYNCQEITLDLNGRKYSIWFTKDIQINHGPFKINGLPGLIVELTEETNKIKLTLDSVNKLTDNKEFLDAKNYLYSKPILSYIQYEKKITDIMTSKKATTLAKMAELGADIKYDENQSAFTQWLIDIPANLVNELKKIN